MTKLTRDQQPEPRFDGVLAPNGAYGLPAVRTLSDEYRDVADPEDSSHVPPADPPGRARRLEGWLRGLLRGRRAGNG